MTITREDLEMAAKAADTCHYADKPPEGYRLLGDCEPAKVGDMAYLGWIGGKWVSVRAGMNIAGATMDELWGNTSVMAVARRYAAVKLAAAVGRAMESTG